MEITEKLHEKLFAIKFRSKIPIKQITNKLLEKALNSSLLEEALMEILVDPKKVRFVLRKLNETNFINK